MSSARRRKLDAPRVGARTLPALAAAALAACGPAPSRSATQTAAATTHGESPPPAASVANEAPTSAPPAASPGEHETVAPAPAAPSFPPRDFSPPYERSAAPGDGRWTPFGTAMLHEPAATAPPIIVRTVVHPHAESKWITVTIAAIDLARVAVHLVPGTEDLEWAKLPVTDSSGLVPAADRERLLAVMNGGFQPKHGRWGLVAEGTVVTPPRETGCTLALFRDGTVRLGSWSGMARDREAMTSVRQTPPCLVEDGALHPSLLRGEDKAWAGHNADLATRRRSAVGLDATRSVLFYGIGEEADPRHLGEALRAAGATAAAELDINWYWTRFLLFGTDDKGTLRVTSTLVPKMEHLAQGYVSRPSTRDFFYLAAK